MRANRSCPRSSVPRGWARLGPCKDTAKSMSLMRWWYTRGPKSVLSVNTMRTVMPKRARRCRQKRRQKFRHRLWDLAAAGPVAPYGAAFTAVMALSDCSRIGETPRTSSAVGNPRVEKAIDKVSKQIEQNHQSCIDKGNCHNYRRVGTLNSGNQ